MHEKNQRRFARIKIKFLWVLRCAQSLVTSGVWHVLAFGLTVARSTHLADCRESSPVCLVRWCQRQRATRLVTAGSRLRALPPEACVRTRAMHRGGANCTANRFADYFVSYSGEAYLVRFYSPKLNRPI